MSLLSYRTPHVLRSLVLTAVHLFLFTSLKAQTARQLYVTDGVVKAIAQKDSILYIGGTFNHVGPGIPYGTSVSTATGAPNLSFAVPNGIVETVVPDGSGGWYIGGVFSKVGNLTRNGIARISSTGTVTSFNANLNAGAYVRSIVISGSNLCIGGGFTAAGGASRINFALVDAGTGAVVSGFAPAFNGGPVSAIVPLGSNLYVGGYFRNVNGNTSYPYLAAINASSGALVTAFAPSPNRLVEDLAASGSTIYANGSFTSIGGGSKSRFAAVDASSGALISTFSPPATNGILDIELVGTTIYMAGFSGLSAISASTGSSITGFSPVINGAVYDVHVSGSNIYIGGSFDTVAGVRRPYTAQLTTSGSVASLNPQPQGTVRAIAPGTSSNLYLGGEFPTVGAAQRRNLAAINTTTGVLATATNLDADGTVNALLVSGTTLYAGGDFTLLGGATHNYLGSINTTTRAVNSGFTASADGEVLALAISGSSLFAGGNFTTMDALARTGLAAVNATNGSAISGFDAQVDDGITGSNFVSVRSLLVSGSNLYLGGEVINSVGGSTRNNLAAVSTSTGALVSGFTANLSGGRVNALTASATTLYVGGNFSTINSNSSTVVDVAAFNLATGSATSFALSTDNAVNALWLSGTTLYVGGDFYTISSFAQGGLAAVNAATGAMMSSFKANAVAVNALLQTGNVLYAGGDFIDVNGSGQKSIVALNASTGVALSVKLSSFAAANAGARNRIDWTTATETGNNIFEVERSANGSGFEPLGAVAGKGSRSGYVFYDEAPLEGTNYYRLKITDESAAEAYSSIAVVHNTIRGGGITVTPVPATTSVTIRNTDLRLNGELAVVYDMGGRQMTRFEIGSKQELDLRLWPSGIYMLRLPEGRTLRLVKE